MLDRYGTEATVDTVWIRDEIVKLRSQLFADAGLEIDRKTWKQWRLAVGLYQLDENLGAIRDSKGGLVPSKRKTCTQRQAALLVMVALWRPMGRPFVQQIVGSPLRTQDLSKAVLPKLFDEWARKTGAIEGQPLLGEILKFGSGPTLDQLSDLSEELLGERSSVRTLARKIKDRKPGPVRRRDPVPNHLAAHLVRWMLGQLKDQTCSNQSGGTFLTLPPGS